jgi:hypothetical protein
LDVTLAAPSGKGVSPGRGRRKRYAQPIPARFDDDVTAAFTPGKIPSYAAGMVVPPALPRKISSYRISSTAEQGEDGPEMPTHDTLPLHQEHHTFLNL